MSKKDFELIASTINKHVAAVKEQYADASTSNGVDAGADLQRALHEFNALKRVSISIAAELRDTHPAFKHALFVTACGVVGGIKS